MSILRIAQSAGVSKATVSKVMSESDEISAETKAKVIKAAKELGFYDKYYKPKRGRQIIAVICPEIKSDFYNTYLSYLESKISARGAYMLTALSNFNAGKETEQIHMLASQIKPDGIIVLDGFSKIQRNLFPIVVLNSLCEQEHTDAVNTDFYSSVYEAVCLFKTNGHTKIGFIGEALTQDKYDFFIRAMSRLKLDINDKYIIQSNFRFETAGYLAMEELLKSEDRPTAVFAAYDYIALGAIRSIQAHGMSVPADFSVIGIDDIDLGPLYNFSLTTIKTNAAEICDIALELLFKKIENPYYKILQNITVKSRLKIMDSVAKAKSAT